MKKIQLALLGALLAIGCGGAQKPEAKMAATEGSIRAAEEFGAQDDPQAALYLKFAKENQTAGLGLIKDDEYETGSRRLEMAQQDAELALTMIKAKKAGGEAKQEVGETKSMVNDFNEESTEHKNNGSTP